MNPGQDSIVRRLLQNNESRETRHTLLLIDPYIQTYNAGVAYCLKHISRRSPYLRVDQGHFARDPSLLEALAQ